MNVYVRWLVFQELCEEVSKDHLIYGSTANPMRLSFWVTCGAGEECKGQTSVRGWDTVVSEEMKEDEDDGEEEEEEEEKKIPLSDTGSGSRLRAPGSGEWHNPGVVWSHSGRINERLRGI